MVFGERLGADRGSAIVEFIVIGVGVLVPLAYVVVAVAQVIGAQAAAQQAVREAGRVFVRDTAVQAGEWRAREAAHIAFADRGLELPGSALNVSCAGPCLAPGSTVSVQLAWDMPLPWMPAGLDSWAAVPIRASSDYVVDEFRPAGA
jgi:hypothetical protein